MPRSIDVTVDPGRTERLVEQLNRNESVLSVQVFPGASIKPNGDVLHIVVIDTKLTDIDSFIGKPLVAYWTSFSVSSIVVPLVAAVAGVIVILTDQPVLTSGVMVALALIPGAAITGACLVGGQWEYALRGFGQWSYNALSVGVVGLLVFGLKRILVHKRSSWY